MLLIEDEEEQVRMANIIEYKNTHKVRLQFDSLNGRTKIITPVTTDEIISNKEAELLQFHRDFGHIPFSKLQIIAKNSIIPSRLANCPIPTYSACMAGMISRQSWRDKPRKNWQDQLSTIPGQVTNVDIIVSPTPSLIAQMTSILKRKRYRYATVYVDQASRLGYVYLQSDASVETTLKGKLAYKRFAKSHGVIVKGYYTDNGIFKAKG